MLNVLFEILLSIAVLLSSLSCSGGTEEDGGENFVPGDYDSNISGDHDIDGGDSDADASIPDCMEVCYEYCAQRKMCSSTFDQQQYYKCRESCRSISSVLSWENEISCAYEKDGGCSVFEKCLAAGGLEGWRCDPVGNGNSDGDKEEDSDAESSVNANCRNENDCSGNTHCDPETMRCLVACDPYAPQCPAGSACNVLLAGELAGLGMGLCIPSWNGAVEGALCIENGDCAPGYLCGYTAQCEKLCDPDADRNDCDYRLNCRMHPQFGVGTCAFCIGDEQCGNLVCENGYCVEDWECRRSSDCTSFAQGCFHGKCESGCASNTDCRNGAACDSASAYCYGDFCTEDCAASGQCCNRHDCGPCCENRCATNETCAYDPRCYPDLFCCVEPADCREKAEGYCGSKPCSRDNGACGGSCPVTCSWGYGCGLWSDFECRPLPPEPCNMVGMNCSGDFACMMCNGETLGESGQCVATDECPVAKLDEGMSCYPDPLFSLECQYGHTCCLGKDGRYACCPAEKCINGLGCDKPGYVPPAPYTCRDCDKMAGEWFAETVEGACSAKWSKLILKRDEEYDCFFVLYHDSTAWADRIVDLVNCDNQPLFIEKQSGTDSECVLFLDSFNGRLAYHCKGTGVSCRTNYVRR